MKSKKFRVSFLSLCLVACLAGVAYAYTAQEMAQQAKDAADDAYSAMLAACASATSAKNDAITQCGYATAAQEAVPVPYRNGPDWNSGVAAMSSAGAAMSYGTSKMGTVIPSPGTGAGFAWNCGDDHYELAEYWMGIADSDDDWNWAHGYYDDAATDYTRAARWDAYQSGYYYAECGFSSGASNYFFAAEDFANCMP